MSVCDPGACVGSAGYSSYELSVDIDSVIMGPPDPTNKGAVLFVISIVGQRYNLFFTYSVCSKVSLSILEPKMVAYEPG